MKRIIILIVFLSIWNLGNAQCKSEFSADQLIANCYPISINFADTSTNAVKWLWDFGNGITSALQNPTVIYTAVGKYTISLIITTSGGCSDTLIKSNYIEILGFVPNFGAEIMPSCNYPISVSFTDSTTGNREIGSKVWEFGDGSTSKLQNPVHNYLSAGNYTPTLIVNNKDGSCPSIAFKSINIKSLGSDTMVTQDGATLTAKDTVAIYQWLDCNTMGTIVGATNQSYTALKNGTYAVILSKNGCVDTSACYAVTRIGIIENDFGSELQLYPNPTDGNFSIDLEENYSSVKLTILDLTGRLIQSNTYNKNQLMNLQLQEPPGIYVLTLESDGRRAIVRLIKE